MCSANVFPDQRCAFRLTCNPVHHGLQAAGEFRAQAPATVLTGGEAGAVSVEVAFADGGTAAVAETVRVTDGEPEHLTGAQR